MAIYSLYQLQNLRFGEGICYGRLMYYPEVKPSFYSVQHCEVYKQNFFTYLLSCSFKHMCNSVQNNEKHNANGITKN